MRAHHRSTRPWFEIARYIDCCMPCRRPGILPNTPQAHAAPPLKVRLPEHPQAAPMSPPQSKAPTKSPPFCESSTLRRFLAVGKIAIKQKNEPPTCINSY